MFGVGTDSAHCKLADWDILFENKADLGRYAEFCKNPEKFRRRGLKFEGGCHLVGLLADGSDLRLDCGRLLGSVTLYYGCHFEVAGRKGKAFIVRIANWPLVYCLFDYEARQYQLIRSLYEKAASREEVTGVTNAK